MQKDQAPLFCIWLGWGNSFNKSTILECLLHDLFCWILDTMWLVRDFGLKTKRELRHNWIYTIHLMLNIIGITINSDSMGQYVLCKQT